MKHSSSPPSGWNALTFKQRLGVIAFIAFLIQVVTAALVIFRSNRRLARIAVRRADMYPWKPFDTVELEHGGESAQIYMAGSELFD